MQEDENGIDHPVGYFARTFNTHQRNYSTVEKECLALILALQHFHVYVSSTVVPGCMNHVIQQYIILHYILYYLVVNLTCMS